MSLRDRDWKNGTLEFDIEKQRLEKKVEEVNKLVKYFTKINRPVILKVVMGRDDCWLEVEIP